MGNKRMLVLMTLALGVLTCTGPAWGAEHLSWKNLSLEATSGWDFDSNVAQQPDNPVDAAQVPGQGNMVYINNLRTWYHFNPKEPFDVEVRYEYYQTFNTRLSLYDVLANTVTLMPSYLFGSTKAWLAFSYNYTDVDSSKYQTFYALQPRLFHRFSQEVGLELGMNMAREYFWAPLTLGDFDRSNRRVGPQLGFYYFIGDKGTLQAQFNYDYVAAVGRNNQGDRWHLLLNALYQVHPKINLNLFIDLGLEPYYHTYVDGSGISFPSRDDKMLTLGAVVAFDIYKGLGCNVHYYFTRVDSNVGLYDYHRQIVGFLLSYKR